MLERKKLRQHGATSDACEMPGCRAMVRNQAVGKRQATTALYVAGYPIGKYCPGHTDVMVAAWITDEALLSQPQAAA